MKKVSWSKRRIGVIQLEAQRDLLERSLLQVELNLRPESSKETWTFRDELRAELNLLDIARKEVEEIPTRRKKPWSELIVKLYVWSTKERFNF